MGVLKEVLLLPAAPVRGSMWGDQTERQYYDPAAIRSALARLEQKLEAGEIDAEEFDRLEQAQAYHMQRPFGE